ncbi:MAG: hypothetical protein ACKVH7_16710, partial [Alphaproteobacteria bacterium]
MIYLEFIDWDRSIPVDIFRHLSKQDQWKSEQDRKVVNIGRHKGIGGHPTYLSGWQVRDLARLDEWEIHFKSAEAAGDVAEMATFQAMDFHYCGLYDELKLTDLPDENLHVVEYFDPARDMNDQEFKSALERRETDEEFGKLAVVLRRVGMLGPDPSAIAIWTFPDFSSIESFARCPVAANLRPASTGL